MVRVHNRVPQHRRRASDGCYRDEAPLLRTLSPLATAEYRTSARVRAGRTPCAAKAAGLRARVTRRRTGRRPHTTRRLRAGGARRGGAGGAWRRRARVPGDAQVGDRVRLDDCELEMRDGEGREVRDASAGDQEEAAKGKEQMHSGRRLPLRLHAQQFEGRAGGQRPELRLRSVLRLELEVGR
eukprot:IDg1161t1